MNTITYYVWLNSDWAYLGADRLQALTQRYPVEIKYRPMDMPDVYRRTGGVLLPQRAPERQRYREVELARWCRRLGIHVNPTPKYMCPNADLASCLVVAVDQAGLPVFELVKAIMAAEWVEERDISDPATLAKILREHGLDAHWLERATQPQIQALYRQYTDDAVAAGVFGSPSYVFQGELFWGQDRLDMLEETIATAHARNP